MSTKFDLPPGAKVREKEDIVMERKTLLEWDRPQSAVSRLALGVDAEGGVWIAERKGDAIEISQPERGVVRTVQSPLPDAAQPAHGLPRMVGSRLLAARADGLYLDEQRIAAGQF